MLNTCIIRVANKKLVKYVNYSGFSYLFHLSMITEIS